MDARITPGDVGGTVRAPPSKSYTHRAILAAGYSDGAVVRSPLDSADTRATARAVEAFGGTVERDPDADASDRGTENALVVDGFAGDPAVPDDVIDCANSGTTTRLVAGAAGLADGGTVLTGDASLRSRPQGPLLDALEQLGARADSTRGNGQAPLVVFGPITGGEVAIPGDVSSQYITALLLAGGASEEGITIDLTTDLKSAPYVDITLEVLADFGVDAEPIGSEAAAGADGFRVAGGQRYAPADGEYTVPGDFSSISYLAAAGAVAAAPGDAVTIRGAVESAQGDAAIVDVLDRMGADVEWDRGTATIRAGRSDLDGVTVDVGDTPDLLPTIAALGAVADGETRIVNCEHVRYKETDRVSAMAEELSEMGASVAEDQDVLTIRGGKSDLRGATVDGRGDHRLVMALSVAALAADGDTTVRGAEHVDVSFPSFFETLADLGVAVDLE
ncbi:3-phosphoshikimate 1-carboxyvinyltransferase [Halopenitus persicus]|uniref:3-phosphoshikimate 1-carboxyvinyltransferase n=1 Tax=Halopenitus persicus TaxID=1048396 RepID=A0A1H3HKL8_9EURY|nr:3-phosphoshikimate 1-carboxyvinyltransferase [Halopenitus persicus]SDY15189.1 3-phosphoshikimate 1-carboxyvinyltransferase [Halopenitus persicus]